MGILSGIWARQGSFKNLQGILRKMLQIQKHRDNSDPVCVIGDNCAFGMANRHDRIFYREDSNSGLSSPSKNNSGIHAFVDGIVLNVPQYKKYFEDAGYPISRASCSAIVAAAYHKWGTDFRKNLEGEFSCAIWDEKKQRLILARDPYGLNPLHYYRDSQKTDTSAYPAFYAAQLACQQTDVILTGDGPDQIMGGSDHYVFAVRHNSFSDKKKAFRLVCKLGAKCASLFPCDPTPSFWSVIMDGIQIAAGDSGAKRLE